MSTDHEGPPPTRLTSIDGEPDDPGQIGPYRMLQKLGEGGMGEVWLAEQTRPVRRRVALKIIKRGMDTKQVVARFEAERQALALMEHPAVARVFDAGATPDGRPYFVMEHVPGVPITEHCDRHKLGTRERLELFCRVCDGVQHAHQKAIIHRDLKPSNVLVAIRDGKPVPKIIDFGVAKATAQKLTERTVYTELGVVIGTPEYMSPEQAEMTGQHIDTRTDVYALGVMLYELLTGSLPFDSEELRSEGFEGMFRKIREEEPPRPSARISTPGRLPPAFAERRRADLPRLRRQLAGDLDWITMKALDKDRTRRYGSPSELAADIGRHLRNEPVLAGPPSTVYRARKFVRRHKVGVAVAGATVLVLLAFAVTMAVQARRIAAERDRANRERKGSDQVSEFLADVLGRLTPQILGGALWDEMRKRVAEGRRSRGATPGEVEAALTKLGDALASVNMTDTALRLVDEQILSPAGKRIERELAAEPRIAGRLEQTLGETYERLKLYRQAERHTRRAVEIREKALGEEDPATLDSMDHLALAYHRQGRYPEAEQLYDRTLAARRRVLGEEHPDTLSSMDGLANVYTSQGRYAEAEELHQRVLAIRQRLLGEEHPDTLVSRSGLARAYEAEGRYAEAERLNLENLEIQRRVLGEEHPETLWTMNALANEYGHQRRYAEAEALHRKTLEIERRVLGEEHPDTLWSMNNLAVIYSAQGRYAEAEELYKRTLAIRRRVLGEEHFDTLITRYNLGCIAAQRGDREAALDALRQAVEHGLAIAKFMAGDEALDSLHGDPRFEKILERARQNAAAQRATKK